MSEHWSVKHKRNKELCRILVCEWKAADMGEIETPVNIKFIRTAPRALDDDNLVYAFKNVRDIVSDLIIPGLCPGRADGGDKLKFDYNQEKGKEYAIRIEITPRK